MRAEGHLVLVQVPGLPLERVRRGPEAQGLVRELGPRDELERGGPQRHVDEYQTDEVVVAVLRPFVDTPDA